MEDDAIERTREELNKLFNSVEITKSRQKEEKKDSPPQRRTAGLRKKFDTESEEEKAIRSFEGAQQRKRGNTETGT